MDQSYNEQTATEILRKINSKGWNAYPSNKGKDASSRVNRGPVSKLEIDSYVLMPSVDDPTDQVQVNFAFARVSELTNGKLPPITLEEGTKGVTGFTLFEDKVKIHTFPKDSFVCYDTFLDALDTILDVNVKD